MNTENQKITDTRIRERVAAGSVRVVTAGYYEKTQVQKKKGCATTSSPV
jgi:hypothetical protein